jgi:hypothetical protein
VPALRPPPPPAGSGAARADIGKAGDASDAGSVSDPSEGGRYVPLVLALAGTLQRSHLHVGNQMNIVLHTSLVSSAPVSRGRGAARSTTRKGGSDGKIEAAAAYSVASAERNTRIVIGDTLTFVLDVRWYGDLALPLPSSKGGSAAGWLVEVLFGAMVGFGVCYVWVRGFGDRRKSVLPKYNGYAYGVGGGQGGNGFGFSGGSIGKRE